MFDNVLYDPKSDSTGCIQGCVRFQILFILFYIAHKRARTHTRPNNFTLESSDVAAITSMVHKKQTNQYTTGMRVVGQYVSTALWLFITQKWTKIALKNIWIVTTYRKPLFEMTATNVVFKKNKSVWCQPETNKSVLSASRTEMLIRKGRRHDALIYCVTRSCHIWNAAQQYVLWHSAVPLKKCSKWSSKSGTEK